MLHGVPILICFFDKDTNRELQKLGIELLETDKTD